MSEEQIEAIDLELVALNAQLAAFRLEIITGFTNLDDWARCKRICRRRDEIRAMIEQEEKRE